MANDMEDKHIKQNTVPTADEQTSEQTQESQQTQQLTFSVANNRQSKRWRTVQYSWDEFCEKVSHTTRTVETVAQYALMKKKNRDDIKDVGGYVGGKLKNGRRKKETVVFRSCLTLDMDYGDPDMDLEGYLSMLLGCRAVIYSTHTHRPENPRYRIVIPLSRDVSPDEYSAIARKVAADIDIELFDDTTYEAHRLMYWPSTSSDGEFYYRKLEGEVLDADEILSSYADWRDVSSWPVSERQNKIETHRLKKQEDPLEKPGLIGAFCRAYFPIDEAITEFLPELYRPCDGSAPSTIDGSVTRYDYIPADSSAGALVYGGKFMYSHHATDPACNQLLNAFDLVRIHKFGELDNKVKDGVIDADADQSDPAIESSVMRLPSYKKMVEFASNLKDVKAQLAYERLERAQQDFEPLGDEMDGADGEEYHLLPEDGTSCGSGDTPGGKPPSGKPPDDTDDDTSDDGSNGNPEDDVSWQLNLELTKNGTIKDTLDNIVIIMENDSRLKPISYNLHRSGIDARSPLPWEQVKPGWNDSDASALKVYLNRYYGIYSPNKTKDALLAVTAKRAYHPIRDYFASLPDWDGTKRVDTLFIDYLGAEDTPYTRAVTRKALAAAVARIFEPGIKFDSVLILIGPQGIGKSTLFARLGGEWFSDSLTLTDMRDKSGAEKMQGYWIMELGELVGMKKADVETVKSFISRTDDKYRASYGVNVESHPRQCIIVGSTNTETGFLRDVTGNRRFWPLDVSGNGEHKPWQLSEDIVHQLWAEAYQIYKSGELLYLTGEEAKAAEQKQADAIEADEREGLILKYLDTLLPLNWDTMTSNERYNYLNGYTSLPGGDAEGVAERTTVSNIEIWAECFGKDPTTMRKQDSFEIRSIMQRITGWKQSNHRPILPLYGQQRVYEKVDSTDNP